MAVKSQWNQSNLELSSSKKLRIAPPKMKPSSQGPATYIIQKSSSDPSLFRSNKAVDGVNDTDIFQCTHTTDNNIMWWLVDLEALYQIHSVILLNRDVFSERLQNFTVDVFEKDPKLEPSFPETFGRICAQQVDPLGAAQWTEFNCRNGPIAGQFVRIVKYGFGALSLCEVRVFENPLSTAFRSTFRHVPNTKSLSESREALGVYSTPMQCGLTLWQRLHLNAFHFNKSSGYCEGYSTESGSHSSANDQDWDCFIEISDEEVTDI
ncbi:fucolectin-like [Plakobranchus ocellatus]|uniref:Fucolectin-like n=1 Tax=Plakobranchus ocellatus TaxID=259542 RepID=A0AAV3YU27_9GAST|nr:fucolectin-like [Plakobranchus ocellatus]